MIIFSATICATDSVAALAMVKPDQYPKLFSILFGEGKSMSAATPKKRSSLLWRMASPIC